MINIQNLFVKYIYGDHNLSKSVNQAITKLLNELPKKGVGLNVGSGKTNLDSRIKNLELEASENIDYVGSVESIPEVDNTFDLVISQEVLEHVLDPVIAMSEIRRVLKKGGKCYIQLPFIIGYHPCPNDYWRFTKQGIIALVETSEMRVIKVGESVGSATGFYRISVEFFSILFSLLVPKSYKIFKGLFALFLYPVKWLDPLLRLSNEGERVSGGYYIICIK
jgi:SAM-dependent methyltransferase